MRFKKYLSVSKFLFPMLFLLSGCVYYNTLYNAEDCYKQALASTPPNRDLLDKSIQKCEKIISYYPKSKWVPNAIFLMGKCFSEEGDYDHAIDKFKELMEYYPKSKLVDDGRIELARAYLKKGDNIEARNIISEIKKEKQEEINVLEIETYFITQEYDTAIKVAKADLPDIRNPTLKTKVYTLIASSYDSLGKYKTAIKYYDKALKLKPRNLPVIFASANAMLKLNDPGQALDKLLHYKEVMTDTERDTLNLIIAQTYRAKKDFTKAIETLDKIKTSPEAAYEMGVIYEEDLQDFNKAKQSYDKAKTAAGADSILAKNSVIRSARLDKLIEYQTLISKQASKDSLSRQPIDTLKAKASKDSLSKKTIDTLKIKAPKDSLTRQPIDTLKTKAYKDSLSKQNPDTQKLAIDSVKSSGVKPKKDSLSFLPNNMQYPLPNHFPKDTLHGQNPALQKLMGKVDTTKKISDTLKTVQDSTKDTTGLEDVGKVEFLLAELYLFDFGKIDDAIKEYQKVMTDYPKSSYAPKAAYSIGWIMENEKKDTTGAISAYEKIEKNFPDNKYAAKYVELAKKAISRLKNESK